MISLTNMVINVLLVVFVAAYVINYAISQIYSLKPNCDNECLNTYFEGPPRSLKDPTILSLVKESFLDPPPTNPDTEPMDIYRPIWRKLVDWYKVQENLWEVWKDQPPGTFVEVGAVDGEFMSQTLMLEKNLSWSGLLIEPDPRSYKIMRERRRNAWTSPLCIHFELPLAKKYWLRDLDEELPEHFLQLLMARSKLDTETLTGDEERGKTIWVKCMTLSTVLLAAQMTSIDLLTIATGADNDETRIKDILNMKFVDIKTILIHYPTGRLFTEPYPALKNYIIDMEHSTLLVKYYVKETYCKLIAHGQCRKIHYYDTSDACSQFLCFGFLTVWSF